MHFPAFIKFFLWILFDFTIRKCCGIQLPEFSVSYINKCWHKDSFFTRRSGISLQQCVKECDNRRKCGSINYRRELKLCELIPTPAILDDSATADGQCTIVNRNDIKAQNNCDCAEHEVCNPKTGNCTVEECAPFTIKNGKFLGNMNVIGSRVKFTCNQDNTPTISICLVNGTWSVNPPCNTDVSERVSGTNTCDKNAMYKNTQGSYICTYKSGSHSCCCVPLPICFLDVNECDADTDTCDDKAVCENTQGTYICTCKSGYTGDGQSCTDVNECDAETNTCDDNAVCENTPGSYTCTCKCGYTGDGYTCTGQCPPNFVKNNESCYLFGYGTSMNWNSARAYCHDNCKAHLVHIDDQAENDWIASECENGKDHWINLSDSLEEGEWIWKDTGIVAEYTNWDLNRPVNSNDCAVMQKSSLWYVSRCDRTGPNPICELEIR